jgi:predicted permease
MLAAAAAAIGVLLSYAATGVPVQIIASGRESIDLQVKPDPAVLLFTAGIALLSGVLFGIAPAWRASRLPAASELRETGGAGDTPARRIFGRGLVASQVAFSVVLLSAAGLFVRHLVDLGRLDLGFRRDHVLLLSLDPSSSGYSGAELLRDYRQLLERLEAIPGVRSASMSAVLPMSGMGSVRLANVEGYQAQPGERRQLSQNWVAPKYFETLGVPLLVGRDFNFEDQGRPPVVIVNRTFVRYFFGEGNPIGKHITFDGALRPYEIIGVVGDAKSGDVREPSLRFVYLNLFQPGTPVHRFALRTAVDPASVVSEVRRTVRESLPTVPVMDVLTLQEQVDASIVPERISAMLSGLFGALGSTLAALGLYGLLAYTVARRIGEIGLRMALGATPAGVTRMVMGEALGTVCAGLIAGAPLANWGRRFAAGLIEGLPETGALPIIASAIAMLGLALLAAYVPARRAARVDPVVALRTE